MDICKETYLICRTCGTENQDMTPISHTQTYGSVEANVNEAHMECASVQVHEGDGLPQQMCSKCTEELSRAFLFRKMCEKTDSILRMPTTKYETDTAVQIKTERCCLTEDGDMRNATVAKQEMQNDFDNHNTNSSPSHDDSAAEDNLHTVKTEDEIIHFDVAAVYNCEKCCITYDGLASYVKHLESTHGDLVECGNCNERFAAESSEECCRLIKEKPGVSIKNESEFSGHDTVCNVCGKRYKFTWNLKVHKRVHTGERPYKCDVCDLCFIRSNDLKRHKMIHSGDKPYKCRVCALSFNRNTHLKRHMTIHTREDPYKCDVCPSSFTTNFTLTRHKAIHSKENPYIWDN